MVVIDADRTKANDTVDPYLFIYLNPIKKLLKFTWLRWRVMIPAVSFIKFGLVCGKSIHDLYVHKLTTGFQSYRLKYNGLRLQCMALRIVQFSLGDKVHSVLTGGENCYTILRTIELRDTGIVVDKVPWRLTNKQPVPT